jgi:hypothetical protein
MRGSRACQNWPSACDLSRSVKNQTSGVDVAPISNPPWNPIVPPFAKRVVVVAGQCSRVGKTSLAVDLIGAFPLWKWTAVKITPHVHSGCPVNGSQCNCAPNEHTFAIHEEHSPGVRGDTARFLAAGAKRSVWIEAKDGHLAQALPRLAAELVSSPHIIIESNAILQFWRPAMLLVVLDPANPDFKSSATHALLLADAFVFRSPLSPGHAANSSFPNRLAKPTFLQTIGDPLPVGVQELARQLLTP